MQQAYSKQDVSCLLSQCACVRCVKYTSNGVRAMDSSSPEKYASSSTGTWSNLATSQEDSDLGPSKLGIKPSGDNCLHATTCKEITDQVGVWIAAIHGHSACTAAGTAAHLAR